ncbi:hypothetical protein [Ruminiclostridium cellobioparum]|uniref:hypothetical protein n=1 Tax=Ruminiclostridium cellobioparum TaxID=29355 RepID=UPI0004846E39|nr:hypothetical protein [Ruminiclostridium cellobioparum]
MKKLYKLINFQFGFISRLVLLECLLLIVAQNMLLYITAGDYPADRYIPFEKLIALSGVSLAFYIGFTSTLAGCVYSILSDYSGSRASIRLWQFLTAGRPFISPKSYRALFICSCSYVSSLSAY